MSAAFGLLLAAAQPVAADQPDSSSAVALVDVSMRVCYRLAANELKLGGAIADDTKALEDNGITSGLMDGTLNRLGRDGVGLISQSIIGQRAIGEDIVLVAVGGTMPGCRSILLSKAPATLSLDAANSLVSAGWKEAPANNAAGAPVARRMFVKRGANGQPYLLNMFTGTFPQSDFQVMTTINPIPPGVQLPEGF
ncbi:MAG: hypothetical protein ACRCY3_08010 [Sphingorhabdus sp.]